MSSNPAAPSRQIGDTKKKGLKRKFEHFSTYVTKATGSPMAFLVALATVLIWAVTGPFFNYSSNWQLIINTGTTIVTFLMIFVIQQSQNKDTMALHLKLNELIAASELTSNRLIDSEDLTEDELQVIKKYYQRLSKKSDTEDSVFISHSIDEADFDSKRKQPPLSVKKKNSKP